MSDGEDVQGNSESTRLSDRILAALDLALEQEDLKVAELLTRAMEMSMTRNTGGLAIKAGCGFIEHENPWISKQRACYGNALALTAR